MPPELGNNEFGPNEPNGLPYLSLFEPGYLCLRLYQIKLKFIL